MRRAIPLLAIAVALAHGGIAAASWHPTGSGHGFSRADAMAAGNTPSAGLAHPPSGRDVTVSWTASGGSVPVDGYLVKRYSSGGVQQTIGAACSGTIAATSCTESSVPAGSWRYSVTPVHQTWRGAESAQSSAVTVGSPALALSAPTTISCLPGTLSGTIANFLTGESVTFRLDNPTSGQVLSGSVTPSPVPNTGTASASVTIPAGVSDGSHTVYAVGDQGDTSNAATFSVGTSGIRVASGSYTGNGANARSITGAGFQPDLVIVKRNTTQVAVARLSTLPVAQDLTKPLSGATGLQPNMIKSLDANGFTVGTDATVNAGSGGASSRIYYWTAFKAAPGHLALGTYTGSGASRSITGLGFSPEYVMIAGSGSTSAVQRMSAMTRTFPFDSGTGTATAINSLDGDGFSLGTDPTVNQNGGSYNYAAFNQCAGEMKTSSYTGNGAASQTITGVGFQPADVIIRANDATSAREGVQGSAALPSNQSLFFSATGNPTNAITALGTDGFTVGGNAATNANGVSYPYVAFHDKP
jgi:hypothetical protein